jgi:hypothetical protein
MRVRTWEEVPVAIDVYLFISVPMSFSKQTLKKKKKTKREEMKSSQWNKEKTFKSQPAKYL